MTKVIVNPFSGPAYVVTLKNALENNGGNTSRPRTGGEQISLRLESHTINHINVIAEHAGWNRSEVLTAVIERGLFDLYGALDPNTTQELIRKVTEATLPMPHHE
jgi:hypothetical protein